MSKRSLTILTAICLGLIVAGASARVALGWGWWSNRELNRASDYVHDVMKLVHENYVAPDAVPYDRLRRDAVHGMVESLDPHSEFLEEKAFSGLDADLRGDFGGVGIHIELRDNRVLVIAPIAGTPAERAGIRRGDEIVAVDATEVSRDVGMDDMVQLLRGEPGTKVSLTLVRTGEKQRLVVPIIREIIKVDSVRSIQVLEGGIGYIQIAEFSERTSEDFLAALDHLWAKDVRALVIDLRNNPGGLLDAAVAVAEPFFQRDELIVYTEGRLSEDRVEYRAATEGEPLKLPVAVLINSGSASAAEVLAGALKDTHRAVIVGERSFGKGSVQTIFELKNGEGMRLTTARYYTPSGVTIHEKGIEPQIEVVMTPAEDEKISLQRQRDDLRDPAAFAERFGFEPIEDRQLQAALAALRGVIVLDGRAGAVPPALEDKR
ncbi:MAG: S41 family peptidase [Opitutaceae bacterium]|jgi:carboxyl-terminal processing protease|nr:S41 family peptidase [Opitutaceae bacterium]MBP8961404.1 S41 family peptidase [Opitutaceae bacterium]HOD45858.1 S41 family peptidase [Opitutaceae bacterium]